MSIEKLRPASFKGVPFHVADTDGEVGRRTVLHEYPGRDLPFGEDLGRAARSINITAIFVGDDAAERADALIDALETAGAGQLVHPWRGSMFMQLSGKARVQWPSAAGGQIRITLALVAAGDNAEPRAVADVDGQLAEAADALQDASTGLFEADWLDDVIGWLDAAANTVEALCSVVEGYLSIIDQAQAALDRILAPIQRMIDAPARLGKILQTKLGALAGRLATPVTGLSGIKDFIERGPLKAGLPEPASISSAPTWTASTIPAGIPALPASLAAYTRRTLLAETCRALPQLPLASRTDVQRAQVQIVALLDAELRAAPDSLFVPLSNLRTAVIRSMKARLPDAAEITILETRRTLPALVLAYQVNGDISQADDVASRNGCRHPGRIPAGRIEVLRHG